MPVQENMVAVMLLCTIAAIPPHSGEALNCVEFPAAQGTLPEVADLVRSPTLYVQRCTLDGFQI
jgi:hypothetical protein